MGRCASAFARASFYSRSPVQRPDPGVVPDPIPALPRISDNVTKLLGKLPIIADEPIKGLILPDAPKALMLALHLTGGERLPGMQNRFELVPGKRLEEHVNMIIHHDISGELIALTVEALDRRHHQAALAGVKLLPTSTEPPGNKIGDLVLPPVRKVSPVTKFHDLLAVARARTPAHHRQAGTPVPLISSHQTQMPIAL